MADNNQQTINKKNKLLEFGFIKKIKSMKHFNLVVAIILSAIILLIYFSGTSNNSTVKDGSSDYSTINEYTQAVEAKLQKVLSTIEGAGDVEVMVRFDSGLELVIAYSTETKTTTSNATNGGKSETTIVVQTPILVEKNGISEPIVLKEKLPMPVSVVIVSSGAGDVAVKLNLIKAAQTTLGIESGKIEVFAGNKGGK